MLLAQASLLTCFMIAGGMTTPHEDPNDLGPVIASLLGVMAMAVQNAGSRLILANHGPTTMMTGNTTQAVIDLVDFLRGLPGETPRARKRFETASYRSNVCPAGKSIDTACRDVSGL